MQTGMEQLCTRATPMAHFVACHTAECFRASNAAKRIRSAASMPTEFWRRLGNPKSVCAPMVDASELAFRDLTHDYGCDLGLVLITLFACTLPVSLTVD